ncbi:hypothetical protein M441DRAFT_359594 [Trichoderma asperellum CBS 433.97]|uniref:Uncharacterized protein n=1 Tax=Trichoderma asperellum (strain ATCC 204424 / CBS 433.97 / NBRC 101777) TaxID=1042311 RepID=A0A2T3ZDE2_TRIA4|nr:hypothetical protein M441DRAFT_359594 [Trichoderma asperellum CBS 433.97]PTB42819.1 hypothetical protein M441DRAFT_359594 [Trichoderma asperellum CBS 433.97]
MKASTSMTGHCDKWGGIWLNLMEVEVRRSPDSDSLRGVPVNPASPKFSPLSHFFFYFSHMRSCLGGVCTGCRYFLTS